MTEYVVERLHFSGDGLARGENGRWIHIANALAGERVTAENVSICRRRQAVLGDVLEGASDRCEAICGVWRRCPACQFQCMKIEAQRAAKRENWLGLIRRFVDIPEDVCVEFLEGPKTAGYRHRTDAVCFQTSDGMKVGIYPRLDVAAFEARAWAESRGETLNLSEMDSGDVSEFRPVRPVLLSNCALHAPELNALIARVESCGSALLDGTRIGLEARGDDTRLIIYAEPDNADALRAIASELSRKLGCCLIFQVLPPHGSHVYPKPEQLSESPWYCYAHGYAGEPLYALKGAWTPVNPDNAVLIRKALSRMMDGLHFESMLELGCGCGTHSSLFLEHTLDFTGIDASWPAIMSAQHNGEIHGWSHAKFYTDTAEHYLDKRYYQGRRAQAVVMHSNRMPYSEKTAEWCLRFGARDIFIVAPTAYAMAQECRHFVSLGCRLCQLTLCDTLPMTYHMMAVAHLVRE